MRRGGDLSWKGLPGSLRGLSWEAAGEGERWRRGWEPSCWASACSGLQVAGCSSFPSPSLASSVPGGPPGTPLGLFHSGLGRVFTVGHCFSKVAELHNSGETELFIPRFSGSILQEFRFSGSRVGLETFVFYISTGPCDMRRGFRGPEDSRAQLPPQHPHSPGSRAGGKEPPESFRGGRGGRGEDRREPGGPQFCPYQPCDIGQPFHTPVPSSPK